MGDDMCGFQILWAVLLRMLHLDPVFACLSGVCVCVSRLGLSGWNVWAGEELQHQWRHRPWFCFHHCAWDWPQVSHKTFKIILVNIKFELHCDANGTSQLSSCSGQSPPRWFSPDVTALYSPVVQKSFNFLIQTSRMHKHKNMFLFQNLSRRRRDSAFVHRRVSRFHITLVRVSCWNATDLPSVEVTDPKWTQILMRARRNFPFLADECENSLPVSNSAQTFCTLRLRHHGEVRRSKTHFWGEGAVHGGTF